jgi:hypothetical protein
MRFAGTWKQYSKKAINPAHHDDFVEGTSRYFRCPYHAKVMKMLEMVSTIVFMGRFSPFLWLILMTRADS